MAKSKANSKTFLSLATSEKVASVCVTSGVENLAKIDSLEWLQQFSESQRVGKSTAIISMTQAIMNRADLAGSDLGVIALTNGPGGFTGLRVGVVVARMLCYAWKLPVIVVNSLEVAADKLRRQRDLSTGSAIWAVTDAQRRQVFAAKMVVLDNGVLQIVERQNLFERQALIDMLQAGDHVTGSGAFAMQDLIESKTGVELPGTSEAACDAVGVANLALRRFEAEDFDDFLSIEPIYFRPSAAEEVRMAKENSE